MAAVGAADQAVHLRRNLVKEDRLAGFAPYRVDEAAVLASAGHVCLDRGG